MKGTKELKTYKGITLIALVITIIVMLILVAVTISMAVNGGLFDYAGRAASKTNEELKAEEELANGKIQIGDKVYNSIEEYLTNKDKVVENVEKISKETSYVGYYADVDGDKVADGVIYADLAIGEESHFNGSEYAYEAVLTTELKDYYVSGTHNGDFGNGKGVLTATGEGKDRFYVMALTDISTSRYTWYESKNETGIEVITSTDFGAGKTNTETMLGIWKADEDEAKSSNDLWGHLTENSRWFVPSLGEWLAFASGFNICGEEYDEENNVWIISNGLSDAYWFSSCASGYPYPDCHLIYDCAEDGGTITSGGMADVLCVRLSTTF